ncbi:MAG: GNAT family N-acetyltransferase [Parcubacteria group bacterium]|nr:GNAT family N-acetyltransferase [Parcubacteria group bacterium]
MQNLVIEKANRGDMEKVREFYRSQDYNQEINQECKIIVAQIDDEIIGVVRVCPENGIRVLRGMQIKPEKQGRGIGSRMLCEIKKLLEGKDCFAIPYKHLEEFYGQIGFKKINEKEAPEFLDKRIIEYRENHPDKSFILMKKSA